MLSALEIAAFYDFYFLMTLFRGAISRDLSVMKLHCLLTSTTCLPPLCTGMCSGVLDLEGIGDMHVCVCLSVFKMPAVTCL